MGLCKMDEDRDRRKEFERQVRRLEGVFPATRVEAAKALRDYPEWSLEPLCGLLRDKDLDVRTAAAESLGHIGDQRAIQPLTEALRDCFVGKSARGQLVVGVLVLSVTLTLMAGLAWGSFALQIGGAVGAGMNAILQVAHAYYRRRQSSSKVCQAITDALAQIAERNPTPVLRSVLSDLKAVAADVLQQHKDTRAASRQAAERIESLTEQLKDLPVAAFAPEPDGTALPRPADAPAPDVTVLPRVHQ
jgi:HEAT repeat protein